MAIGDDTRYSVKFTSSGEAKTRAEEITGHFSHDCPDGKSCFTVLRNRNRTLGENIAAGNVMPETVVDQ